MMRLLNKFKIVTDKLLYQNSFYLMFSSILTSIFGMFFWIVVSRYYSPTELGLATAILSTSQLISAFSGLGLGLGLVRYFSKINNKNEIINSCLSLTGLASLVLVAIYLIGLEYWTPALSFIDNDYVFMITFSILTISYSLFIQQGYVYIALRSTKLSLLQNVIFNIIRLPLPILLVSFGLSGIIYSWTIATFISLSIGSLLFIPLIQSAYVPQIRLNMNIIQEIISFSFENYIAGILGSISIMIIPIMVIDILGSDDAAYFYIAFSIASTLTFIPIAVTTSLFAEGSKDLERFRENIFSSIRFILILLIPSSIVLILASNKILGLFGDDYSKNAIAILWLFIISSYPFSINQIYMAASRIEMNTKKIIYINSLLAFLMITGSYFFMIEIGLVGIGWAWLLSNGLTALIIVIHHIQKRSKTIVSPLL